MLVLTFILRSEHIAIQKVLCIVYTLYHTRKVYRVYRFSIVGYNFDFSCEIFFKSVFWIAEGTAFSSPNISASRRTRVLTREEEYVKIRIDYYQ